MGFWDDAVIKDAEAGSGFDPVPEGIYRVLLTDSEVKATKSGGHYLNAKFELHGNPEFDGRVLFHKFNWDNSNAQAVSIGLGQIKDLAIAAGQVEYYERLKEAADRAEATELLNGMFDSIGNVPVEVKVVVKQDDKYGPQNDIKRFKSVSGAAAAPVAKAAAKGKRPF